jgi:radical SAM superfamily enzyme YgiQ (UPF0313 family)
VQDKALNLTWFRGWGIILKEYLSEIEMQTLDCLIIHTPKFKNYYKPVGQFMWVNYMPLGLLGIADYLNRNSVKCRVLHQGVEWMNDKSWHIENHLECVDPSVFALSLHWHYQAYDVIESCRIIRKIHPNTPIVLGGSTASYFHDEIVGNYDCVDAVIRGDGEIPLLELVRKIRENERDLSSIPNLTWRNSDGSVVCNAVRYCADEKLLNDLRFANMELLSNYRTYIDYVSLPFIVVKGISKKLNFKMFTARSKLFPLCVGRGCAFDCTWCGGSFTSQKEHISCRKKVAWRGYDAVIVDIKQALAYGYQAMYTVFDSTPDDQSYFVGLFRRIRNEGLTQRLGWMHEATGVTTREFVDAFAKTFSPDFRVIALSPETGNEEVRKRNKGHFCSNLEYLEMLDYITSKKINVEVFFTYGIPGENEELLEDTYRMRNEILKRYGRRNCLRALSIELEPGAPWHIDPEKYGIVTSRRTFADFLNVHAQERAGTYTDLGYYIPDYFKKPLDPEDPEGDFAERLQKLKCKHFCFIHPDGRKTSSPFWGRMLCRTMGLMRFVQKRMQ